MMSEQSRGNEKAGGTKRTGKRVRLIVAAVVAVVLCVFFWRVFFYESVDEKLAAIEAARAIPDSENAALIYYRVFEEFDELSIPPIDNVDVTREQPWLSKDFPELAKSFEQQQGTITKLLQVSRFEKCRFPILPVSLDVAWDRYTIMRKLGFTLVRSANNDMGEGQIDQGLEKYICLIRMGRHCRQQPVATDFLLGTALEALALQRIRFCILQSDATEEHLSLIEAALSQARDEWIQDRQNMLEVDRLYDRKLPKTVSLLQRLKAWWQGATLENRLRELHARLLADRRGSYILVALRRFRNRTGRWPESLDEIGAPVAEDTLIDLQNNGPFVYKRDGDGFVFYSKGLNGIDEGGSSSGSADDWPIWPRRMSHMETKGPNIEQPNADNESTQ